MADVGRRIDQAGTRPMVSIVQAALCQDTVDHDTSWSRTNEEMGPCLFP